MYTLDGFDSSSSESYLSSDLCKGVTLAMRVVGLMFSRFVVVFGNDSC